MKIQDIIDKFDKDYNNLFLDITGHKCATKKGYISREKVVILMGELRDKRNQELQSSLTSLLDSIKEDINLKPSGYLLMSGQVDEDEINGYEKCRQEVINIINSHR